MLRQIEERQAQILTQFIGKPITETAHFFLQPNLTGKGNDTLQRTVLFYFSRAEGICESDDYDALPVTCTLRPDQSIKYVRQYSRPHKSILPWRNHNFKYRLPSQALLSLQCELFDYQVTLPVAQFGAIIDLPHNHFKALFDPTSGAIIYYED